MTERLQKCIAQSGACSRRQAESWIREGRVTVNGESAVLGQSVDPAIDRICIDGRPLELSESELVYIMLNKPRGYVSTVQDERGRKTIMELVSDVGERLYPVGRLDMYSQGLLLMTNDGTLTKALTHPSHDVKKEYQVRVVGEQRLVPPLAGFRMRRLALCVPGEAGGIRTAAEIGRFILHDDGGFRSDAVSDEHVRKMLLHVQNSEDVMT